MKKKLAIALVLALAFVLAFSLVASAEFVKGFEKNLELYPDWIGSDAQGLPTTMPIFNYSTAGQYISERLWLEVPCDTDRDGKRDRISLYIRRPVTKEGFLCPVVMEFSPYHNGYMTYPRMSGHINSTDEHLQALAQTFRYHDNYPLTININPDTTELTYEDIKYKGTDAWDPIWWSTNGPFTVDSWYTGVIPGQVPASTPSAIDDQGDIIYGAAASHTWTPPVRHRQFFVRGYALIYGQLLGNIDCEGITNSLHVEEWISSVAVIKWLNGECKAFTTRNGDIEVKADWCNGHVSMDGTSYPGTTPIATALSGVKGLKAIMPEAHLATWYEGYRSGGALHSPDGYGGEDINLHASYNFSRFNSDVTGNNNPPLAAGPNFGLTAQNAYIQAQQYMMKGQDRDTGDYNAEWDSRNFTRGIGHINPDVGILQTNAQQDWNVVPKHGYMFLQAMRDGFAGNDPQAYGTHKLVSGLSTHASQNGRLVPGKDGVERGMDKWYLMFLDHFLLGLDNHVDELMYDIYIANNITGVMEGYDYDPIMEERGTIIPGTHYNKIYLTPGPEGKAGRLSYYPPVPTVEHFADLDIHEQLTAPLHLGVVESGGASGYNRPPNTIGTVASQGNRTASSAQAQWCEDRYVGVHRLSNQTAEAILAAVDKPNAGRLLYLSEPLTERMQLSGTAMAYLKLAPDKGMGNLSVAILEIGRKARVAARTGSSVNTTGSTTVFPAVNGADARTASRYANPVGNSTCNFKYVTWGHTDVQNPGYGGKAWFDLPEQNYVPDYYFQTTKLVPGQYYDYTVELNPYNYTFDAGTRIAVMVFGTDPWFSPLLTPECTAAFDLRLGAGSYVDIPLKLAEPEWPVTIEVSNILAKPGAELEVTYSIKDNDLGFSALDLQIPYDNTIYTPIAVTASGALASPFFVFNPAFDTNLMRVAFVSSDNIAGDGILFTVKYKIAGIIPVKLDHPLTVLPVKMQYGSLMDKLVDLDVVVKDGGLVIGIPGDINGDGLITPEDAMLILQMLVGLIDWTPRALLLGDVNGDGLVDTTDAALILRMVVGG
ncbi:MAG: dockerin type I domain-containing protein [Clostridiales bacterium]|jgi:predicted acyl esterase|nr:dockerin type I domain-containing protein [Clostridiales bacterium]